MSAQPFTQEEIRKAAEALSNETLQNILRCAAETFGLRMTMTTVFGSEGCCLIHMLAELAPDLRIFNLDTGYQFEETLQVRERIKEKYGIEVELVRPELTVAEYEAEHGGPLYRIRPDQCCYDRKMIPLRQAGGGDEAGRSGHRKDEAAQRADGGGGQRDPEVRRGKGKPAL